MADSPNNADAKNSVDTVLSAVPRDHLSEADAKFIPALLIAKIEGLEKELRDLKPQKKDIFERLSQLSGLITGGAIAGVGTIATIYYNFRPPDIA